MLTCTVLPPGFPPNKKAPVLCGRREEVSQVFNTSLLELVFHAASVHRMYNDPRMVCTSVYALHLRSWFLRGCCLSTGANCTSTGNLQARKSMQRAVLLLPPCWQGASSASRSQPLAAEQCWVSAQVQRCTLLSIKTGGCPETCTYCAQSSSWSKEVGLKAEKRMGMEEVLEVRPPP